ncbi:BCL-6 corepressor isoform X2 [Denticeps clupeoides]|uniref:BCL-6 corepressor n=1 Tax=Denticeps clupeoides TaxID=299321 RepID=A0AAY4C3D9_9TELE|nr:BCL-6 corepressor-like isoform X2 [Denticeps clupeoides]
MVDASAACRMNPLAALGIDRSGLMRESLRVHGGMVYPPGIRTLPTEKAREGASLPLGYVPDLLYKPDVSLDGRKQTNGYVGLYKSPPPGLQKPMVVPGAGADTLGLDRRVDKPPELGLNGSSSFLRLPWVSPYHEAAMYPFLDSSKYMYKTSIMSQPPTYLSQHLAYQSLCAGAGGSAAGAERLFYVPPYPSPMASPLAPPMRIPTASVAPNTLSPLMHCQDKSMQSIGPRIHHEPFGQQLQPQSHLSSHSGSGGSSSNGSSSGGSKSSRTQSGKSSSSGATSSSVSSSGGSMSSSACPPVDTSPALVMQSPRSTARPLPQPSVPVPPPPPLIDSTLNSPKTIFRSPSSSSSPSMSHPFYVTTVASEHRSPVRSSAHKSKSKEGSSEHRSGQTERKGSKSPSKTSPSDKPASQAPTKDPADKPLDLSAKIMDFEGLPNGYPAKLEALAKLGYSPAARYGLPPNHELLKETLSPPTTSSVAGTSSKTSERPEIISTLHSSWVVPSSAPAPNPESNQNKGSSVIKNKNLEHVMPQQRSSSCPRIGESNSAVVPNPTPVVVTPAGRPASASPSPKVNGEWPKSSPTALEKPPATGRASSHPSSAKSVKTPKKAEAQDIPYKPQHPHLENGHPPGHLYMPQSEAYLTHNLAYANRYLPYSVPEMPLSHLPLPGKGPVYPHPVLLASSTLYPAHLPPKPGLPYGIPPGHGEYLTYHDSQEMVHPLMSPHLSMDPKVGERLELRPRPPDKPWHVEESPYKRPGASECDAIYKSEREAEKPDCHGPKQQNKPYAAAGGKEDIVCIDLIQDYTDGGSQANKYSVITAKRRDPTKLGGGGGGAPVGEGKEPALMQVLLSGQPAEPRPAEAGGQPRPQELSDGAVPAACLRPGSPCPSQGDESPAERSPLTDLLEEQTQRCARTSGDRTSEDVDFKADKHGGGGARGGNFVDLGKEVPEDRESHEEEEEGVHGSLKSKRSSLAKRIANSSGYVGDRFKCVTTELYADSSKLSREQRALQRAMMRFSELELKEKEGGAAAAGRDLAAVQRGEGDWERSQRSSKPGAAALAHETEKNSVQPPCTNNRVPVLQRCGVPANGLQLPRGREPGRRADERRLRDGEDRDRRRGDEALEEDGFCVARRDEKPRLKEESHETAAANRKRPHSLEHGQAYPDRQHAEGREVGGAEAENEESVPVKRLRPNGTDGSPHPLRPAAALPDEEVKNLKVRIELTGLRLSKPHHLQHLELWESQLPLAPAPGLYRRERAEPLEVPATDASDRLEARPAKKDRSWREEALGFVGTEAVLPALDPQDALDQPCLDALGRKLLSQVLPDRQRVRDHRRSCALEPQSTDSDAESPTPWHRRHGDPEKPKGKRQCKTKHLSRERKVHSHTAEDCPQLSPAHQNKVTAKRSSRKRSASLSDYESSPVKLCPSSPGLPAPPAPQQPVAAALSPHVPAPAGNAPAAGETPASRPMPPEARRLIVNKNAGETLLQRAARLGYEEVVLYCLENKVCDVNHRDNAGYCALHEACARGWLSIVQHLIEHGADINCSAQDGTRPLHDAVENDHLDVVRLLLSYGADPTLATYSGRSLLKMTHSEVMECFLSDYFADLQGRPEDDPRVYWEFYGSAVCEPAEEAAAFDILANPPGPGDDDGEQREVFEFEFSDRPLLPCYNIQVSLSQGPRNWLLLSDVLKRLKMSARAFRATFKHIEVATIAEAEFYKQASLSQLFSCPEELEGFMPDSKELLDLVEISSELVALLGSSLECLDDHWDHVAKARS